MNISIEEVIMVLSGAYCTKENSHKEFDATLVQTMAINIINLISDKQKETGECEKCYHLTSMLETKNSVSPSPYCYCIDSFVELDFHCKDFKTKV